MELTSQQVQAELGVSARRVQQLVKAGVLAVHRRFNGYHGPVFLQSAVEKAKRRHTRPGRVKK